MLAALPLQMLCGIWLRLGHCHRPELICLFYVVVVVVAAIVVVVVVLLLADVGVDCVYVIVV